MPLITADFHLDDNEKNAYRWEVFSALRRRLRDHGPDDVFILGDLTDRANHHSATLVHALVAELQSLVQCGATGVHIIRGNHDAPMKGPGYWLVLNRLEGGRIRYHDRPTALDRLVLLPWTSDPDADWRDLDLSQFDAAFLHMTVPGAMMESGIRSRGRDFAFPSGLKLYSGDVHTPQTIGQLTYVGAPHPVKFGDTYPCRVLVLDGDFGIAGEITLNPPRKLVLEVGSVAELEHAGVRAGDSLRIRMLLPEGGIAGWQERQREILAWASACGGAVASLEPVIEFSDGVAEVRGGDAEPEEVLAAYCAAHGIGGEILQAGLDLLAGARDSVAP